MTKKEDRKMISSIPITLPVLEDSERLEYEQIDWHNYRKLLTMFEKDRSIFVMNDYKTIDQLEPITAINSSEEE